MCYESSLLLTALQGFANAVLWNTNLCLHYFLPFYCDVWLVAVFGRRVFCSTFQTFQDCSM